MPVVALYLTGTQVLNKVEIRIFRLVKTPGIPKAVLTISRRAALQPTPVETERPIITKPIVVVMARAGHRSLPNTGVISIVEERSLSSGMSIDPGVIMGLSPGG